MIRAITLLTENFSDWETALINSTGRGYYGFDCRFATPGAAQVTSSGGMLVSPHLAIEAIQPDEVDLLIVCGALSGKPHRHRISPPWLPRLIKVTLSSRDLRWYSRFSAGGRA